MPTKRQESEALVKRVREAVISWANYEDRASAHEFARGLVRMCEREMAVETGNARTEIRVAEVVAAYPRLKCP